MCDLREVQDKGIYWQENISNLVTVIKIRKQKETLIERSKQKKTLIKKKHFTSKYFIFKLCPASLLILIFLCIRFIYVTLLCEIFNFIHHFKDVFWDLINMFILS